MSNAFDTASASQGEPTEITAGDLITWRRDDLTTLYPTSEYTLSYSFQSLNQAAADKTSFAVTATEDSAGYYAQITGATTLALAHYGTYSWQAYITRTSDNARVTIGQGRLDIITDLASQDNEQRNHAEIMIQKIESLLEGKADSDVSNYSIQGRSLTKFAIAELLEWRDYYRAESVRLKREEDVKLGRKTASTIKVRFS